jgi:DNA-binding CsgD family transcriptional regulator
MSSDMWRSASQQVSGMIMFRAVRPDPPECPRLAELLGRRAGTSTAPLASFGTTATPWSMVEGSAVACCRGAIASHRAQLARHIHYGGMLVATDDWPAAEVELLAGVEMTRGAVPGLHRLAVSNLAELRFAQGRVGDVERLVAGDDHHDLAHVHGQLHLWHGRPAAAIAVLRRRLDTTGGDRLATSKIVELLGEAELACGHAIAAAGRAEMLIAPGSDLGCELLAARGHRLAGRAAHAAGAPADARRHLDTALVGFARLEMHWEALRTRLLLAAALEQSEPEVAAAEARAALAAADRLGSAPTADEAAAVLRRLGIAAARGTPGDGRSLTQREEQVLALIGHGLSNPEIAARLHLSRKTVEHHVAHVLSKLGARHRTELAGQVGRRATTPSC